MPEPRGCIACAMALAAGHAVFVLAPVAHAQWLPGHPYSITRIGLLGPDYVSSAGYSQSSVFAVAASAGGTTGYISGTSLRIGPSGTVQGQAAWVYDPITATTLPIGLGTPGATLGTADGISFQTPTGQVAGAFTPIVGLGVSLGMQSWVWSPATRSTERTGLWSDGFIYTISTSQPYSFSENRLVSDAGWVAGISERFTASGNPIGTGVWVYNPVTRQTVRMGLFDNVHTGVGSFQSSDIRAMSPTGQVAGVSTRFSTRTGGQDGTSVWVYQPSTNTTRQLGAAGPASEGTRQDVDAQTDLGHIALRSLKPGSQFSPETQETFAFDPIDGAQSRTGLFGTGFGTSSTGEFSTNVFQNPKGQIAGISRKFAGMTPIGQNAWFYNALTRTTTLIGLTGASHTGVAGPSSGGGGGGGGPPIPAGYQYSEPRGIDVTGRSVGISARISGADAHNGQNAWLYRPANNTTVQIGLSGPSYSGSAGYQFSEIVQQSPEVGRIVGSTRRISGINTELGQDLWVFDLDGVQTEQVGLTGGPWRGSSGYQFSGLNLMNADGALAGYSQRITAASTETGQNTWALRPNQRDVVQTGLTTPAHTSGSYQFSDNIAMDRTGRVVGFSRRLDALGMDNGQNIWVFNPATGTTLQTGLTATANTGSGGYQFSDYFAHNTAGQIVGTSRRVTGVSTFLGDQDVWYFDSATGVTHAIVGVVQGTSAYAEPMALTEDGTLFGRYAIYSGPGGSVSSMRAFAFRPDRGFADLGSLVSGGLAANGWTALQNPNVATGVNQVVGSGLANIGTATSPVPQPAGQSVFVLTAGIRCGLSDIAGPNQSLGFDGTLNADDIIVFLSLYFAGDLRADVAGVNQSTNPNGSLSADDIIVFLSRYFAGC